VPEPYYSQCLHLSERFFVYVCFLSPALHNISYSTARYGLFVPLKTKEPTSLKSLIRCRKHDEQEILKWLPKSEDRLRRMAPPAAEIRPVRIQLEELKVRLLTNYKVC